MTSRLSKNDIEHNFTLRIWPKIVYTDEWNQSFGRFVITHPLIITGYQLTNQLIG